MNSSGYVWGLEKYAVQRAATEYQLTENVTEWKLYEKTENEKINMVLTESCHLMVLQGQSILENYSLWNAEHWMKTIVKGDSMLFMLKIKNEHRRFRVKFSPSTDGTPGAEVCQKAADILSTHLPVKSATGHDEQKEVEDGTVPLSSLVTTLTEESMKCLPVAYQNIQLESCDLEKAVRLCLSDSNFPAFVADVEKALNKVKQECET